MDKSSIYFPEPGEIEPFAMAFAQMMVAHAAFEAEVCQLQGAITGDPDFGEQVHNQWGAQVRPEHIAKLIDQHFGETIPEKAPIVQLLTHAKAPCDDRNLLAHGQWWRFDPNTSTIDVRGGRQRDDGCVEHNRFTVAGIHEIIEKFKNLEADLFKLRRSIADRAHHFRPLLDAAADYVQTEAPRLVKVAGATAISFALFDGVDRALGLANQQDVHGDAYQTALGYRGDTVSLTVVRLAMLLDRNPRVVSFQHIYSHLKRPDAVNLLVDRACHASPLAAALDDRIADDVRASTKRFLEVYEAIDWHNLHGRLQHFRNRGLVHLTPEQISERVSYAEIRSLVRSVTVLAECLTVFDPEACRFVWMKSMSGAIGRKRYGTRPWGAYEDTSSPLGRIARLREAGTHTRLPLLIAIDGADGCGKSSLASWLAWQLGMPAIQLDLYLSELHPMQWLAVELARVVNHRINNKRPVIVDGVCALDVVDQIAE